MNASQIIIARMRDNFSQAEYGGSLDDCLNELATKAGEVLDAACAIVMLSEAQVAKIGLRPGTGFGDVLERLTGMDAVKDPAMADSLAGMRMFSAIVMQDRVIGVIHASQRQPARCFDTDDLQLFGLLSLMITKSIQVIQMQHILKSRFTQIALTRSAEKTIGDIVAESAQSPNQMARILAKSFYREMISAGFSFNQIVYAATEVISELTENMRKHKDAYRRRVAKVKTQTLESGVVPTGQADAI
jgi:L-methionine (R)-S-oxide reductase